MLIFCSWCERYIGEKKPFWDRSISHSICKECYNKFEDEIDATDVSERDEDESLT